MQEISNAIKQICTEKGLEYEAVVETIESALAAAYRKDYGKKNQNIKVEFNEDIMKSKVYDVKTVVEDMPKTEEDEEDADSKQKKAEKSSAKKEEKAEKSKKEEKTKQENKSEEKETGEEEEERKFNPKTEIELSDARLIKKTAKVGDEIKIKLEKPEAYGRMAAQTAKQVIIQKLREAERDMIFNEFKDKEGEVVSGVVQRKEGGIVLVDLGKSTGVLGYEEQIPGEQYVPGDRIKVYVKEVALKPKGPEIVLSRTSEEILKKVFYLEIPEIANGLIELKSVAREAGSRAKVAVWTDSENVDPIGSCVGQRGARIQTIIAELGGEKVDIIEYDEDPAKFISNALSPAKILHVEFNEEEKKAKVVVAEDQLSLAIGKGGQNARLAARLTGWKIDIVQAGEEDEEENLTNNKEAKEENETGEGTEETKDSSKNETESVKEPKTAEKDKKQTDKKEENKEADKDKETEKKKENTKKEKEEK